MRWLGLAVVVVCASACNQDGLPSGMPDAAACECMSNRDCGGMVCFHCMCQDDRVMDLSLPPDLVEPADLTPFPDLRGRCPKGTDCGGVCVDLAADPSHCGACNNACPNGIDCIAGKCVGCRGLTNCSGACVDTATDIKNCGGCGMVCGFTYNFCVLGMCSRCRAGLTECGAGCVDVLTDPTNCGACRKLCGGMVPACVNGFCK